MLDLPNGSHNDRSGFGSMKTTFYDARKKDKSITMDDVQKWFNHNVGKKNKTRGYNSYVAHEPYYEFQLDLMFFNNMQKETGQKQKMD